MSISKRRVSRRAFLRASSVAGVGAVGLALVGCGDDDDDDDAPTGGNENDGAAANPVPGPAQQFDLVDGWYQDRRVRYYDFGMNTVLLEGGPALVTAPIYAPVRMNNGAPEFIEGQRNIIDVVPGDEGYSDLWQVMLVIVDDDDYEANDLRSKADVDASGFDMMPAGFFVNCPVVPAGSTLEGGEELVAGWYKGADVFYPDFGMNINLAVPIWAFATGIEDGAPVFVEGQQNIINVVPGETGYSAFWRVNLVMVDDTYEPNSLRSADDVLASDWPIMQVANVVNCPVTEVADA